MTATKSVARTPKPAFVWAVEIGSYSDYRVVGVFSSAKRAQMIADAVNISDSFNKASVSRWPLDPAVRELSQGMRQYIVYMRRDGSVERCERWETSPYEIEGCASIWRRSTAQAYKGTNTPDVLNATVWAKDEKHAIKVANEHRTRMIAEGQWK